MWLCDLWGYEMLTKRILVFISIASILFKAALVIAFLSSDSISAWDRGRYAVLAIYAAYIDVRNIKNLKRDNLYDYGKGMLILEILSVILSIFCIAVLSYAYKIAIL